MFEKLKAWHYNISGINHKVVHCKCLSLIMPVSFWIIRTHLGSDELHLDSRQELCMGMP